MRIFALASPPGRWKHLQGNKKDRYKAKLQSDSVKVRGHYVTPYLKIGKVLFFYSVALSSVYLIFLLALAKSYSKRPLIFLKNISMQSQIETKYIFSHQYVCLLSQELHSEVKSNAFILKRKLTIVKGSDNSRVWRSKLQ